MLLASPSGQAAANADQACLVLAEGAVWDI